MQNDKLENFLTASSVAIAVLQVAVIGLKTLSRFSYKSCLITISLRYNVYYYRITMTYRFTSRLGYEITMKRSRYTIHYAVIEIVT